MKMISLFVSIVQLAAAGAVQAQSASELSVWVGGYVVKHDGGETMSVAMSTGPIVVGKTTNATLSAGHCGVFHVSGAQPFMDNATSGWRVEMTPTRVAGDAVTFRLHWVRALDAGKTPGAASEDVELTLRPGESRPLDSVPISPAEKAYEGRPCKASAVSLRVKVDRYPDDDRERRLVAADLWLIERLANGTERSQALSLRGLPSRAIPFYFDRVVDGSQSLDIFGRIIARPETGAIEVSVQTISRSDDSSDDSSRYRNPGRVDSVIHVKPEETVEVGLPKLGESAGPFASRAFSIRIRARQLR